jgi:Methyltransferase domain
MPMISAAQDDVARGLVRAVERARPFVASRPDPDIVTDRFVTAWLDEVSQLLDAAQSASLTELGPDHSRFENIRARSTAFVRPLQRAPWLSESTRSKVGAFVAACPAYVHSRYKLTYDCFSSRIPRWEIDLARFAGRPDLRFLEIGSFEGHSACWLLEHVLTHDTSTLTCVDFFHAPVKELFDHNIALVNAAARVETRAGDSRSILPQLPLDHYDFVYVDGSHDQIDVLEDAMLSWRLLKRGGLMTFDDYGLKDVPITQIMSPLRPDLGIDAFLLAYAGRYRVVSRGFQVTVEKLRHQA